VFAYLVMHKENLRISTQGEWFGNDVGHS